MQAIAGSGDQNSDQSAESEEEEAHFQYDSEEEYKIKEHKAQDLHRVLAALLKTYRKLEKDGMVWCSR